ncbi:MAG: NADH-quinone oxidoreductase subunit NuoN [Luteococcus sp.]|uniref:NADH-quinone oxidoreductase subunit NuoN n=1 Tax=Luteococcus sp. TaxID=1969402 RepID=UPI0026480782|nr:NADH-quinone oxidoreductase subunit NuoN [Luteococcus sp.]MDN5562197.1 NADH-quinone oxidoreductase subunit NuoN [Luteococcus sp.]
MSLLDVMIPLEITAPKPEFRLLAPLILVLLGACLSILVETTSKRGPRYGAQLIVSIVTLGAALALLVRNWIIGNAQITMLGSIAVDGPTWFAWGALLVFGLMTALLFAERRVSGGQSQFTAMGSSVPGSPLEREAIAARAEHTEVFPLLLFSLFGMMLFASANDLLVMFVALEIFSLPLYLLAGLARRRRMLSQEAALKYFLLGALSSAMFLYGTALLYGYAGSFQLRAIDQAISAGGQGRGLLLAGMGLVAVGLLFKIGAVPFHSWTPDVYTGSPTPVTAFMAICTKFAAVVALMRVFYVGLGAARWDWQPLLAVIAVLTMCVGALIALTQTDVKRMLAYSSIAHAGFILVAIVGANTAANGLLPGGIGSTSAVLVYLAAYGLATLGAFGLVTMVRKAGGEATSLAAWQGVGRKSPALGALMALFLLSFAGVPPTAGFIGKLLAFTAAWKGGYPWLVGIAILMSLVAAFIYIRMIVVMFFRNPVDDEVEVVSPSWMTWLVVILGAVGTLVFGIYAQPLLDLAGQAGVFLR